MDAKKNALIASLLVLVVLISPPLVASEKFIEIQKIRTILELPDDQIDLAAAKLTIDRLVDPSIDEAATQKQIDHIVMAVNRMVSETVPAGQATHDRKMQALRSYLYDAGEWNQQHVFQYDLDDPFGTHRFENRLLSTYLQTRKGNCFSMPILFLILGDKLGLDVTLSTAPYHVFIKYWDDQGRWLNLETTSGAKPAREVWLRQQFDITETALNNGLYLQPLSRKESVAVMASLVMEHAIRQGKYIKAGKIADLLLQYYPKHIYALTQKATAISHYITREFESKYPRPIDIPTDQRGFYAYLDKMNYDLLAKAKYLGWRRTTAKGDERYLQKIEQYKQTKQLTH